MKILIIEDEQQLAADMGEYLSSEDYLCEFATDFDQALEKIAWTCDRQADLLPLRVAYQLYF